MPTPQNRLPSIRRRWRPPAPPPTTTIATSSPKWIPGSPWQSWSGKLTYLHVRPLHKKRKKERKEKYCLFQKLMLLLLLVSLSLSLSRCVCVCVWMNEWNGKTRQIWTGGPTHWVRLQPCRVRFSSSVSWACVIWSLVPKNKTKHTHTLCTSSYLTVCVLCFSISQRTSVTVSWA